MKHLAIFNDKRLIEKILSGEKKIEGRFSFKKSLPYCKIKKGDEIYLKESGGMVWGSVYVDNVLFHELSTAKDLENLKMKYHKQLKVGDDFWQKYKKVRYATLIFLTNPRRFLSGIKLRKKDRRGWVIINQRE